jgi:hypothetical protein
VLFASDTSVQIAYIALAGALAAPIITGIFGIATAVLNKRTNADTSEKIERSAKRVSAFEDMAARWQRCETAREYFEKRCDRQEAVIVRLRRQIVNAGMTPDTGEGAQ